MPVPRSDGVTPTESGTGFLKTPQANMKIIDPYNQLSFIEHASILELSIQEDYLQVEWEHRMLELQLTGEV